MRLLVTGGNGQLGQEIAAVFPDEHQLILTTRAQVDITNFNSIWHSLQQHKPTHMINTAAYTAVDRAETEYQKAWHVNTAGTLNVALACQRADIPLVHISTDFVFDGNKSSPYVESDPPHPLGAYGRSKLWGEGLLIENYSTARIVRTGWLYSSFGNNFVKTMLRLARTKKEIGVVCDQIGTPTYARDFARALLTILPNLEFTQPLRRPEDHIFHYSNEGVASWYDFAKAILEPFDVKVVPIPTSAYPTPAVRPAYSVLSKKKIKNLFQLDIPYWRDSLKDCLDLLKYDNEIWPGSV